MMDSRQEEVEFQLRKLAVRSRVLFGMHQWPSEDQRWVELTFALLTELTHTDEPSVRSMVEELDDLGLLDPEGLAALPHEDRTPDWTAREVQRLVSLMTEPRTLDDGTTRPAFDLESSRTAIAALHQAATSLCDRHGQRVQVYLRRYGELMLDEFREQFDIDAMGPDAIRRAVAYWLQNVLNMPVPRDTQPVTAYCKVHGVSAPELLEAADRLALNVALLDDMIAYWQETLATAPARDDEQADG